jgi:hypothetical protein
MWDPWGSHLPALIACASATDGPILEVGVGYYSTPILHALCQGSERRLMSVDEDLDFAENFKSTYARPWHGFTYSPDYAVLADLAKEQWSVVFIDNGKSPPGARRGADAALFARSATFVVVHDHDLIETGPDVDRLARPLFPHSFVHSRYPNATIVMGNAPIPEIP